MNEQERDDAMVKRIDSLALDVKRYNRTLPVGWEGMKACVTIAASAVVASELAKLRDTMITIDINR